MWQEAKTYLTFNKHPSRAYAAIPESAYYANEERLRLQSDIENKPSMKVDTRVINF